MALCFNKVDFKVTFLLLPLWPFSVLSSPFLDSEGGQCDKDPSSAAGALSSAQLPLSVLLFPISSSKL